MFKDPKKTGNDRFTGYCKDLLEKIAKELQFDYDIKEPTDGLYGSMQADGSWNGMINMLIKDVSFTGNIWELTATVAVTLTLTAFNISISSNRASLRKHIMPHG